MQAGQEARTKKLGNYREKNQKLETKRKKNPSGYRNTQYIGMKENTSKDKGRLRHIHTGNKGRGNRWELS